VLARHLRDVLGGEACLPRNTKLELNSRNHLGLRPCPSCCILEAVNANWMCFLKRCVL
jgi:hypothetical protein